jgi:low affinity Fe/Cu permease
MANRNVFFRKTDDWAAQVVEAAGSTGMLLIILLILILWVLAGILYNFSARWEALIGTISSIVTILMVFLIQKSQNKHALSIQLKLNELIAANDKASNRLVNVEGMTEDELKVIAKYYSKLKVFAEDQDSLQQSHSIDEVHKEHTIKDDLERELTAVKGPDDGKSSS